MDIKEEYVLPDDVDSQNEVEFFTMETNSDDGTIKTEIKSETPSTKHAVKQSTFETVMCSSNNWKTEIGEQTLVSDFGSQNKGEFLPENPVMKDKKYNVDHEMDNKIEIKEDWHLETETAAICDDVKDGDFPPVGCSRLCMNAIPDDRSGKSQLSSAGVSGRETCLYDGKDHLKCEHQKNDVTDLRTAAEHVLSEQSAKCSDEEEKYPKPLCWKQKSLIPKDTGPHQCKTCNKSFTCLSYLRRHNLLHEGKKPHHCKTCDKSFTHLSYLKTHNLVHQGKRPHHCKTCNKSFTCLSYLRRHNLIHEGKKPHHCKTCEKSFTHLSYLKTHNLVHQGKRPHQCKTCDKSFTHLSQLKRHIFIHEGKKPHQCNICVKSFTEVSTLKTHNLIHEGKKPQQCKTCGKSFTHLSTLKRHNLVHEGNKQHQCKTCDKRFTLLSTLKRHNLIHEGKKPHQCKSCDERFTHFTQLKRHILIHEGKK